MVIQGVAARAVVPDQLLPYVAAVSGLESEMVGSCVLHHGGGEGVLVAYPLHDPLDRASAEEAMNLASELPYIQHLTVLAPFAPSDTGLVHKDDSWWQIPLPVGRLKPKLANILRRAAREMEISVGNKWSRDHERLKNSFIECKKGELEEGTIYIFDRLGAYLEDAPDAALFSARDPSGELLACAIGDFTSLHTAFYMFAFRSLAAPPGTSDLLLKAIAERATQIGHARLNLGLGLTAGVEFFKKKWNAVPAMPYFEYEVPKPHKPGFFARLFDRSR